MSKIDCSVTVNFLREWRRYCGGRRCGYCDLSEHNECGFPACQAKDHPETAVEVIQAWSDEHPVKTRLDDLLEKYPKAWMEANSSVVAPWKLGYCRNCSKCSLNGRLLPDCWGEPVDGGATGEAVE
jgi:hypothetical protein